MNLSLETIYQAILKTVWLECDEEGNVYRSLDSLGEGKREPFIMLEKQVALPTRHNLNRSGKDALLIFHPLMEGVIGGESPVIGKLRRAFGIRYTFAASNVFTSILSCGSHASEYSKFSPDQMKLLKVINGVNEKTIKAWERLVKLSIDKHGMSNAFTDVYISRNTVVNGQAYSRVATVKFPIYDELISGREKMFGSNFTVSSAIKQSLINVFEFMFPNIEKEDAYTVGTNSRIAPYLDALLKTFGNLLTITNDIYDDYNNVIEFDKDVKAPLEWIEWTKDIEGLKNLAQAIPQQFGNYPIKVEDERRETTGSTTQALALNKQTNVAKQHQQQFIGQTTSTTPLGVNGPVTETKGFQEPLRAQVDVIEAAKVATKNFVGLGTPLNNSNGSPRQPSISLQAVIIDNAQSRAMVDPVRASLNAVVEITRQGGVGRVSASQPTISTNHLQGINNQVDNRAIVVGNNNNNNNNGWVSSNNNNWGNSTSNAPNVSAAVMMRELASQRIRSDPSPFNNSGSLINRGSVI